MSDIWRKRPIEFGIGIQFGFLNGNPTVGYSALKAGIRLMFWSGADFGEERLKPGTGAFKDASIIYTSVTNVSEKDLKRWLTEVEVRGSSLISR